MSDPADTVAAPAAAITTLLTEVATPIATPASIAADPAQAGDAVAQQTPADKAETPDAEPDEAAKPAERAAPEKYEFSAPEGTALDADMLGEFEGAARDLKLTQDEAQNLLTRLAPKMAERMASQNAAMLERAATEWAAAVSTDKEIGGDKLPENLGLARKALDAFGSPALRDLLDGSRLGNHPEVIRFMVRAGRQISEDGFVGGSTVTPKAGRDHASSLYPTSQH